MSEITEEQKFVIRKLRNDLKGRCGSFCPMRTTIVINKEWITPWKCEDCAAHFFWLNKDRQAGLCPCHFIPFETLDLRFSELLEDEI